MKFGLFYEMQLPRPVDGGTWDPGAEKQLFDETDWSHDHYNESS